MGDVFRGRNQNVIASVDSNKISTQEFINYINRLNLNDEQINSFINNCKSRGVDLKWFGDEKPVAYTSRYDSWKYLDNIPRLANTLRILAKTFDMRIPLTFTVQDCNIISKIIIEELQKVQN